MKEVWSFTTGLLYVVTPYPNYVFALESGGKLRWKFDPQAKASAQGVACCDVVNRGAFYDAGRLFFNTLDGHAIALDARTGRELWRTRLADIALGEMITMAPLVVKGKVLIRNSGGELGVRGYENVLVDLPIAGKPRVYVAGRLANTPENLIKWIRDPGAVDPSTVMPAVGIDEAGARDIAAYLYTR